MPVPALQTPSGAVLVQSAAGASSPDDGGLGLYARVSSHDQRADLDQQVSRLIQWAAAASASARVRVEAEVASGMTGRRAKLRRLLADPAVRTEVVTHRDRLGRMNAELVQAAPSAHGRRLVVG